MMRQFIKYTVEKKQQLMRQWDFFSKGILLTKHFKVKHTCASMVGKQFMMLSLGLGVNYV